MDEEKNIVFVGGVHGVGKSFFSSRLADLVDGMHTSASDLIRQRKELSSQKTVEKIDENQSILLDELKKIKTNKSLFLLDGHFCLIGSNQLIQKIPLKVFVQLNLAFIIILTADPQLIYKRLRCRDRANSISIEKIETFQKQESNWARFVANETATPIISLELTGDDIEVDLEKAKKEIGDVI